MCPFFSKVQYRCCCPVHPSNYSRSMNIFWITKCNGSFCMHMQPLARNLNQSHKPDYHCAKYINEMQVQRCVQCTQMTRCFSISVTNKCFLKLTKGKGHVRSNSGPGTICTVEYRVPKTMEYRLIKTMLRAHCSGSCPGAKSTFHSGAFLFTQVHCSVFRCHIKFATTC